MTLTAAQRLAREGKLTASRVAPLMTGDKEKIMEVWRELCGDPTFKEPDLSEIWAVQLGVCTEGLNLDWYEKLFRPVSRRGEVAVHPDYNWAAATLDGFDAALPGPVEAKHVSGFEKYDVVLQRYMPQIHWQMEVTQSRKCAFTVIQGGRQPNVEIIDYNKEYADELMARALRFMESVWSLTAPVEMEPIELKKISKFLDYNFTGNNSWAVAANDFLFHKEAAKRWEDAEKKLRELIPSDAATVQGHGVVAKRDRANRISIRSLNDDKTSKGKTS